MSKTRHQGKVIDSIDGGVIAITKWKKTYEEAHRCAENLTKLRGVYNSDRYNIVVITTCE